MAEALPLVVLDTNVVLDLLVFQDIRFKPLHQALLDGTVQWITTSDMLAELARVLAYSHIERWMTRHEMLAQQVFEQAHALCRVVDAAGPSRWRCRDKDDQIFIDLAVARSARLISKDLEVLRLMKPLREHGFTVSDTFS